MNYIGIDQYGHAYHALGQHPRKELMKRIGCQHCSKQYQDKADGSTTHTGYVLAGLWITLYEIKPFEGRA